MNDQTMAFGWFYHQTGVTAPAVESIANAIDAAGAADPAGAGGVTSGTPQGPFGWDELRGLAAVGTIVPTDSVWHPAYSDWVPAGQVRGLFPTLPDSPTDPVIDQRPYSEPVAARRRSPLVWAIPLAVVLLALVVVGSVLGARALHDRQERHAASSTTGLGSTGNSGPLSSTPVGPVTTAAAQPGTWLVMLYMDADDEVLEEQIVFDLNEAELVGSSAQVKIVAQIDRYKGGFAGDGDITSTKRYLVQKDNDIYALHSEELADLGEVDMGDPQTLYDFATWAIRAYPAERYVLIMSDHGSGWKGGWKDNDPREGSALSIHDIDVALGAAVADTGIEAFELVGFDACQMSQTEVLTSMTPHARYAVASEELEPGIGWAYAGFLGALSANPAMSGADLGRAIVASYIKKDIRVTDDAARAVLAGGDYRLEKVIANIGRNATMAAIDLGGMGALHTGLNRLAVALTEMDQGLVAKARAYAQSFSGVFGKDYPPSYIDLGHFVDMLLEYSEDPQVLEAGRQVRNALDEMVVGEYHGEDRPASTGLSIYFPNSREYVGTFRDWATIYASAVGRFAAVSLWDDFLTFHYTGKPFASTAADLSLLAPAQALQTDFAVAIQDSAPPADATIVAPGAAELSIAPIRVSATEIGSDGYLDLSTVVTGAGIAYIYYYVSYYWEDDGSYLTADSGYIEPGFTKEIGGVPHPDWGTGPSVEVDYTWRPRLYFMSDGDPDHDKFAFFRPTKYGASGEQDVYTVRGLFTFVDTGTQMEAEIDFSGKGDMLSVWGFTPSEEGTGGSWHELIPIEGDTFTITNQYLEFDQNPDGELVDYPGDTMTFGSTPFTMVSYPAYSGDYTVGIGVEDLDGNRLWESVEVTVKDHSELGR